MSNPEIRHEEESNQAEIQPKPVISTHTFDEFRSNDALLADVDAKCTQAFNSDYGDQDGSESFSEAISEGEGFVHTITIDGEVIGAGIIRVYQAGDLGEGTAASQELAQFFIVPESRGKGYGKQLLETRLAACVSVGGNMWSILMRGQGQLELYRNMTEKLANEFGRRVENWENDATTQSYAYAYRQVGDEGQAEIVFQGRTPNGDEIFRTVIIDSDPDFAPAQLQKEGHIAGELRVRRDMGSGFMSVNVSHEEFDAIQALVKEKHELVDIPTLDGSPQKVFSVTIFDQEADAQN